MGVAPVSLASIHCVSHWVNTRERSRYHTHLLISTYFIISLRQRCCTWMVLYMQRNAISCLYIPVHTNNFFHGMFKSFLIHSAFLVNSPFFILFFFCYSYTKCFITNRQTVGYHVSMCGVILSIM